jgi:hypothetical protein
LLNNAQNTNYQLRSLLNPPTVSGCKANTPISSLQIEINGSMIAREFVSKQDEPLPSMNSNLSKAISIDFGGFGFSLDLASENILGIKYSSPESFSKFKLNALQRVVISKLGTSIDNLQVCQQKLLVWETCAYDSYEQDLLNITGISIWVNDELVYHHSGLNISLNRTTPALKLFDVQQSEAWVQLMQQGNCAVNK